MYKYETHLHTAEGSACAVTSAVDMVKAHKDAGYDGIFITDHFFNGNSAVPCELPWAERIDLYCMGYEKALEAGSKVGMAVFFGVEFTVQGADFLLYGIDKNWLFEHEFYLTVGDERALFRLVHVDGDLTLHATHSVIIRIFRTSACIRTMLTLLNGSTPVTAGTVSLTITQSNTPRCSV